MTALIRLTTNYYNSLAYDAATNPGGLAVGGHRINLPLLLADVAEVAQATNAAVFDAAEVSADADQVALDRAAVETAAGPVIAGMAAFGFPARVQITNLDTLALSGHFFATAAATGRPAGENSGGYVVATSDGTANNGSQMFHSVANGKLYKRFRHGGAWGSWEELTTAAAGNDTAFGAESSLASAATTNLGAAGSRTVLITGTTTITSFGATAVTTNPHYLLRFAGALTLTHHASNLILPAAKNILTAAGDHALVQCVASGQFRVVAYFRATGEALWAAGYGAETTIASAATVDLGAAAALLVAITGTTTITSFGASAGTGRPVYRVRFTGVLTLTHNGASLILPGGANITTASGDTAVMQYLGSGNWRCLGYQRADGKSLPAALASLAEAKAGTVADKSVTPAGMAGTLQSNGMLYGADSDAGANTVVVTLAPAPAALDEGMAVDVKIQATNTGPATLNLNGLGAVSIKRAGAALRAGDLVDGQISRFIYDGSFWQLARSVDAVTRHAAYVSSPTGGFSGIAWTLTRQSTGNYTITLVNPADSAWNWGFKIALGNAGGSQNLGYQEKTKSASAVTFQVRNGGNNLDDPSSMDIEVWVRAT
ncbi:MAG: pyocin knob domain-containing protein [Caulobacter sp.]|nr:pyocin knob domain-containing protein [Caulobacter sp.]